MRYACSVDVAYNEPVQTFLKLLEKHKAKVENFVAVGPGGGNPNFYLSFPSELACFGFLREYYPGETSTFLESMCIPKPL